MRRVVLIALSLTCLLSTGLAWRSANPSSASVASDELSIPVLSAERLPTVLVNAVDGAGIRASTGDALRGIGNSCLVVFSEGQMIVKKNADRQFTPASTLKLITGAAALDVLGPDTRLSTQVKTKSAVKNGVIDGPLYLVGDGDPFLMTNDHTPPFANPNDIIPRTSLETLVNQVVNKGVRVVNGGVVGDAGKFDDKKSISTWDPGYLTQGQAGAVSGLMLNQGYTRVANGMIATADPAMYAVSVFVTLLRSKGVVITGPVAVGTTPSDVDLIAKIDSPTTKEMVDEMLSRSNNTTAEVLLKNIAAKQTGKGTTADGVTAVRDFLQRHKIPADGLVMNDGSGLDRGNKITCLTVASVLFEGGVDGLLAGGLAQAGKTGTLRDRMASTAAVGRLKAKTGTLSDVSGLAGWATSPDHPPVAFAVIANGMNFSAARIYEDRLAVLLSTLPAKPAL